MLAILVRIEHGTIGQGLSGRNRGGADNTQKGLSETGEALLVSGDAEDLLNPWPLGQPRAPRPFERTRISSRVGLARSNLVDQVRLLTARGSTEHVTRVIGERVVAATEPPTTPACVFRLMSITCSG